jgi:hypothetical protein
MGQAYASSHPIAENTSDSKYTEDDVPINLELSLLTSRTDNICFERHLFRENPGSELKTGPR